MVDNPLSQREFDTWRDADDTFKAEMRQFCAFQMNTNLTNEHRLTDVEASQKSNDRKVIAMTTVISSAVTSALAYLFHRG